MGGSLSLLLALWVAGSLMLEGGDAEEEEEEEGEDKDAGGWMDVDAGERWDGDSDEGSEKEEEEALSFAISTSNLKTASSNTAATASLPAVDDASRAGSQGGDAMMPTRCRAW